MTKKLQTLIANIIKENKIKLAVNLELSAKINDLEKAYDKEFFDDFRFSGKGIIKKRYAEKIAREVHYVTGLEHLDHYQKSHYDCSDDEIKDTESKLKAISHNDIMKACASNFFAYWWRGEKKEKYTLNGDVIHRKDGYFMDSSYRVSSKMFTLMHTLCIFETGEIEDREKFEALHKLIYEGKATVFIYRNVKVSMFKNGGISLNFGCQKLKKQFISLLNEYEKQKDKKEKELAVKGAVA